MFLLYQTEVTELTMAELVEGQRLREGYAPDAFTIAAVAGVLADKDDVDAVVQAHARDWPLDRIAPLERSILRLAVWEIRTGATPPEVAIDEAVRLAKRYSTDEAGAFVNGVLGGVVRSDSMPPTTARQRAPATESPAAPSDPGRGSMADGQSRVST